MSLKVSRVVKGSIAQRAGISQDDEILSINGNEINDFIGLHYHCSEPKLDFVIRSKDGLRKRISLEQDWQSKLGIEPEPYKIKHCSNHCIFCFIDQMPKNLRKSLYVKDDDYLFSFVYGNYVSLNNLADEEFERIVRERISPLYVSVHTTDPVLRKKIMGYKKELDILEKLRFLSRNRISFHTQIVVMPGLNDGEILNRTISELTDPAVNTLSIGLVPVGLTSHRQNLYPLEPVNPEKAREIIDTASKLTEQTGFYQIYCADELFILAGEEIPSLEYYEDFCQLENGIGMIRATLDNWKKRKRRFIRELPEGSLLFVTGKLAGKYITDIAREINQRASEEKVRVIAIENRFFGESVTVSGLLTFQDIDAQLAGIKDLPDTIVLSSNMFNTDGYTLDGVHQNELKKKLNRNIIIINELWNGIGFKDIN